MEPRNLGQARSGLYYSNLTTTATHSSTKCGWDEWSNAALHTLHGHTMQPLDQLNNNNLSTTRENMTDNIQSVNQSINQQQNAIYV